MLERLGHDLVEGNDAPGAHDAVLGVHQDQAQAAPVAGLLARCDALVLPSAQDGFGLVVLEAMACGLPVIVSDRVGAADCVEEGRNGFVFPFRDPGALADRLKWFMADASRAAGMRAAAMETARRHSWEAYGQRLLDLVR